MIFLLMLAFQAVKKLVCVSSVSSSRERNFGGVGGYLMMMMKERERERKRERASTLLAGTWGGHHSETEASALGMGEVSQVGRYHQCCQRFLYIVFEYRWWCCCCW